ncbi:hypothetical protein Q9L58_010737 [Maublancomyces gigas]|uniref:Uncharacterized protein n=1 Tax=Discina gigas TaxID=1032678 RepID=A0ABR3G483_9PEZI
MPIEKTFESAEMDALIESLGSILLSNKHLPFRTVGRSIEVTKLSGLLQQSSNIPQKRTAMHSLSDEDESWDEDEEPALYESTIDLESVLQQIDISSSDDEGPGHLPTAREVTVEELQQFHLFDKEHLTTELDKSLNWTIPAGSQHRFSMQDHLKQLFPALPPPTATGEGRSSSTIVEFSVVYTSIFGQFNWKQNQTQIVQAGILATFSRLTMEWLDQIENDFSDLFRLDDGALVLHPDSVGYRLKKRIDECLNSLTGHNDPTLVFHFDAEAIIRESFDENFHLNLELKPKFRHTNTTRLKAKAYRNVISRMCLFWPLNVFVSMVTGVKPSLKSTVQLPLGSKTNHSYLTMVGRFSRIKELVSKDVATNGLP